MNTIPDKKHARRVEEAKRDLWYAIHAIVKKKDLDIEDYYVDETATSCRIDSGVLRDFTDDVRAIADIDRGHRGESLLSDALFSAAKEKLAKEFERCIKEQGHIKCTYNYEESEDAQADIFDCVDTKTGEKWKHESW